MSLDNPIARYVEGARLAPLTPAALRRALSRLAHAGEADDPLVFVGRERARTRRSPGGVRGGGVESFAINEPPDSSQLRSDGSIFRVRRIVRIQSMVQP